MAKKKSPPKSTFARTTSILGASVKILGKEAGNRIKQKFSAKWEENAPDVVKLRVAQAKILTQNLSQLKGAAMKVGQLLSVDAADFLPKEALDILATLQSDAERVDFKVMREVLLAELGQEKFGRITFLDEDAIAAASIGQVYRVKIGENYYAMKVQYPGVAESIDSDILILKNTIQPFLKMTGRQIDLRETFDEIKIMLTQESDYKTEASYVEEYRRLISNYNNYAVPSVNIDYSAKKVLCMEWMDGQPVKQWIDKNPAYVARERLAKLVLELYMLEFFQWGLVQTDPNFGNFLIRGQAECLILLDFGSCKKYDADFISQYKNLLNVVADYDYKKTVDVAVEFGLLDARESEFTKRQFFNMMTVAMEPFQTKGGKFDFQDPDYNQKNRAAVLQFTSSLKYSPPPRNIIFLHRKLGGIFNFAKTLGVKLDLAPFWQKMRTL